jgi:putative membrane protein
MRKLFPDYFIIYIKGIAMGAADVVPGVSGGTIAFISGIYQELLDSIDKVNVGVLKTFKKEGIKPAFQSVNGGFLTALLLGIATSILSLSKLITYLLTNEPILVWSFFFGLVIASIYFVGKDIKYNHFITIFALLVGTGISYFITITEPTSSPDSYWYLFLSGFLAIIAMILPGISGAFILVLLGSYEIVIGSINQLREGVFSGNYDAAFQAFTRLIVFAIGCILGLKSFSKVLKWMFANQKNVTLALLTGFMIGSLNKVWPWKKVLTFRTNSHREQVPLLEKSILPQYFEGNPQVMNAIILMILGFLTIFLLEKFAQRMNKN